MMKSFVINTLKNYRTYLADVTMLECCPNIHSDVTIQDKLIFARSRVEVIQSWLLLLSDDEKYIIEKRFFHGWKWKQVYDQYIIDHHSAEDKDDKAQDVPERTLANYQTYALEKITLYVQQRSDIVKLFFPEHDLTD